MEDLLCTNDPEHVEPPQGVKRIKPFAGHDNFTFYVFIKVFISIKPITLNSLPTTPAFGRQAQPTTHNVTRIRYGGTFPLRDAPVGGGAGRGDKNVNINIITP
jgi:hypothetical protein